MRSSLRLTLACSRGTRRDRKVFDDESSRRAAAGEQMPDWWARRGWSSLVYLLPRPMVVSADQLRVIERLEDEVVAAGGHAGADVLGGLVRGEEGDRHVAQPHIAADLAARLKTVHPRHLNVEQDEPRLDPCQQAQAFGAAERAEEGVAGSADDMPEQRQVLGRVIDVDDHLALVRGSALPGSCASRRKASAHRLARGPDRRADRLGKLARRRDIPAVAGLLEAPRQIGQ